MMANRYTIVIIGCGMSYSLFRFFRFDDSGELISLFDAFEEDIFFLIEFILYFMNQIVLLQKIQKNEVTCDVDSAIFTFIS